MTEASLRFSAMPSIAEIAAADWNACAFGPAFARGAKTPAPEGDGAVRRENESAVSGGAGAATGASETDSSGSETDSDIPYNPFISHEFLLALEQSGSATARTGWQPQHIVAADAAGGIRGVAPCYLKSHSRGEYVFDRGWAEAYEQAGGRYYPKLQVSVPFTPATGRRLLARPGADAARVQAALAGALAGLCAQRQASSVHVTFPTEAEFALLGEAGWLQRDGQQFHWLNGGYATFEDFLAALNSRHRKAIRRERREALAPGITVHWLTGADLTEEVWDAFFAFYMDTGSRKWGTPYLTRRFYSLVGQAMAEDIVLIMAKRAGRWIAGAINFIGSDTLFGRHWGAVEHHPFLHFELCYYQAIDFAIARGLARVEAGAQGEHKLARGYMPVTTRSAHYIADGGLRRAVADFLVREQRYIAAANKELEEYAPFRHAEQETD